MESESHEEDRDDGGLVEEATITTAMTATASETATVDRTSVRRVMPSLRPTTLPWTVL